MGLKNIPKVKSNNKIPFSNSMKKHMNTIETDLYIMFFFLLLAKDS